MDCKWEKFNFIGKHTKTDIELYRDRAGLLIPPPGEENRFVVYSTTNGVDFFAGSTSHDCLKAMEGFFTTLYDCSLSPGNPPGIVEGRTLVLRNTALVARNQDSRFSGFLRSIVFLTSAFPEMRMRYEVIIRGTRKKWRGRFFNFIVLIRHSSSGRYAEDVDDYITNEAYRLRRQKKWKLRPSRRTRQIYRNDLFSDPFPLYNFVRIPEDEGIPNEE